MQKQIKKYPLKTPKTNIHPKLFEPYKTTITTPPVLFNSLILTRKNVNGWKKKEEKKTRQKQYFLVADVVVVFAFFT